MKKMKNKLKKLLQSMRKHSKLIHTYIHTYDMYAKGGSCYLNDSLLSFITSERRLLFRGGLIE